MSQPLFFHCSKKVTIPECKYQLFSLVTDSSHSLWLFCYSSWQHCLRLHLTMQHTLSDPVTALQFFYSLPLEIPELRQRLQIDTTMLQGILRIIIILPEEYEPKEKKLYMWIQWVTLLHALGIIFMPTALARVLSRFGKRIPTDQSMQQFLCSCVMCYLFRNCSQVKLHCQEPTINSNFLNQSS